MQIVWLNNLQLHQKLERTEVGGLSEDFLRAAFLQVFNLLVRRQPLLNQIFEDWCHDGPVLRVLVNKFVQNAAFAI